MKTLIEEFNPVASMPEKALIMVFDLEGFSKFFNQPDVNDYVPKYLNTIFNAINLCIDGGDAYWRFKALRKNNYEPLPKPIHTKYLGDGGLYIWRYSDLTQKDIINIVNRLWILANNFDKVNRQAGLEVPVFETPKKIRFGIAGGSVYKLTYKNSEEEEYIGYCINLASRLQSYCREIGFIVSARLDVSDFLLKEFDYKKVVATQIKGFPQEIVIIDRNDYNNLDKITKETLFREALV
jgi:class 3 adenylate cyclase